jgi:hypothetical protein
MDGNIKHFFERFDETGTKISSSSQEETKKDRKDTKKEKGPEKTPWEKIREDFL